MKMSECFSMPIYGRNERDYCGEYHYNIYDNYGDLLLPCLPEDVDHEALVFAVNNHDRLEQENAELMEAASSLLDLFNGVVFTHNTHRDRTNFLNARDNLKKLLNK